MEQDPIQFQIDQEEEEKEEVAVITKPKRTRKRKTDTLFETTVPGEVVQKSGVQSEVTIGGGSKRPRTTKQKIAAVEEARFECSVCCTEGKINTRFKPVECPSCAYMVCLPCQKMYGKLDCMNCHLVFRSKWAFDTLGTVFVTKTAKQNKIKELMLQQRDELKTIGPLVAWTERMRVYKKNQKYGIVRQAPEKPDRFLEAFSFPCTLDSCRGHVRRNAADVSITAKDVDVVTTETPSYSSSFTASQRRGSGGWIRDPDDSDHWLSPLSSDDEDDDEEKEKEEEENKKRDEEEEAEAKMEVKAQYHQGECSQCKQAYCMRCQTKWHGEGTHCNKDVLMTMKNIRESTKPCPKCHTPIHKTEGCDHMHCTFCNTFFSYQHGTISTNSTNHHYRTKLLNHGQRLSPTECRISDEEPRIPEDTMRESMDAFVQSLTRYKKVMSTPVRPLNSLWDLFSLPSSTNKKKEGTGGEVDEGKGKAEKKEEQDAWWEAWDTAVFQQEIDMLMDGLYNVPKAVRSLVRNEYSLAKIAEKSREKYDELQIKYTLKEITDATWEQQVFANYTKQLVSELISNVLYIYLGAVDGFQSQLYEHVGNPSSMKVTTAVCFNHVQFIQNMMAELNGLIDMVNDSISEIRYDYCPNASNQVMIRRLGETNRSYCAKQGLSKGAETDVVRQRMEMLAKKGGQRPDMSATPIQPYAYQEPHVKALEDILEGSHFAIDLSPLGTGKTYTAAKIYQNGRIPYRHILTISPLSVKTKWADVNEAFGLQLVENLTYNEIGGKRGINPTHGLLIRNDYRVEVIDDEHRHHPNGNDVRMIDKYVFTPTPYLQQLVEEGVLVVIDEFQHLKNLTAQTEACQTIVTAIMDHFLKTPVSHSRVLFMSGSPIDKQNQVARLYRTLGIMRNPRMVSGFQYAGLNEVIDWLEVQFPNHPYLAEAIPRVSRYHDGTGYIQYAPVAERFMYNTFVNVVRGKLTHTMLKPTTVNNDDGDNNGQPVAVALEKYNGIYTSDNAVYERRLENAVASLEKLGVLTNYQHNQPGAHQAWMRQVTLRMMQIETAKLHIFEGLVRKHLLENPRKKVVLALNYTDSLEELVKALAEYNPLVLNGKTTFKRRQTILKQFQAFSTEHRLLIANFSVICAGIDLDDKHGEYPRVCLASPNYNTIAIYQLGHRFLRGLETKSSTQIFMVYSGLGGERRITESLMRKGNVMKEVLADQVEAGAATFPSDYTEHRETV